MSGRFWTTREIAVLRSRYPSEPTADVARALERSVAATYNMVDRLGLRKTKEYLASPAACRLRRGDEVGKAYRFAKGHPAWNKGKPNPGARHPNCVAHQFKPGTLNGAAARKERRIGTELVSDEGLLVRKVSTGGNRWRRWVPVHRLVWEENNGAVPTGYIVVFKPGKKTTARDEITIDRLECITRAENMIRNSHYTRYPYEVSRLIQLRGALNRKIHERTKTHEQQS